MFTHALNRIPVRKSGPILRKVVSLPIQYIPSLFVKEETVGDGDLAE